MKTVVAVFFYVSLWTCFVLSLFILLTSHMRTEYERLDDLRADLPGIAERATPQEREARYLRKLGNAVSPMGDTPLIFVISAGFLALIEAQRRNADAIVAAITASPDATAVAMRRAVRPAKDGGSASEDSPGARDAVLRQAIRPPAAAVPITTMARPPAAPVPPRPKPAVPVLEPDDSNHGVLDDSAASAMLADLDRKATPLRRPAANGSAATKGGA